MPNTAFHDHFMQQSTYIAINILNIINHIINIKLMYVAILSVYSADRSKHVSATRVKADAMSNK